MPAMLVVEESAYPRQSLSVASELAKYPQSSSEKSTGLTNSQPHPPQIYQDGSLTCVDRKIHKVDAEDCQAYCEHAPLSMESIRHFTMRHASPYQFRLGDKKADDLFRPSKYE